MNDLRPVVLINPRTVGTGSIAQKVFPPVGLMYLAAALKSVGEPVRVIDANATGLDDNDVIRLLARLDPFAVGVPVFDITLKPTAALVAKIARGFPDATLFAGGPAATVDPVRMAGFIPDLDHILRGEAEESIVSYVAALRGRGTFAGIPGLYHCRDSRIEPPPPARIVDLERLDVPDRECVRENYERRLYYTVLVPDRHVDCIVTSRGCPHRCTFCYNWRFRQTYRSVESCVQEIGMLRESGVTTVEVLDDNFTTDRDRAMDIFDRIVRERMHMRFRIKARADAIDERMMRLARRAGVYQVSIGAESGSPDILKAMKKRITPDVTAAAVKAVLDSGAYCHTSFIVGFPGESRETMAQTVDLVRTMGPTSVSVDVLAPYQGTATYEQARLDGTLVGDWSTDPAAETPWIRLDWTRTRGDLEEARRSMLFRIYWNRRYITRYAKMIIGGINPTMGRYLIQEAGATWPGARALASRILKK